MGSDNEKLTKEIKLPLYNKLIVGGIAGIVGTTCIFPLDMIKTRLQASGQYGSIAYKGPLDVVKRLYASEGIRGFYRGLGANLVGVTPEKAIKLAVNDQCREYFQQPDGSITLVHEIISGATAGFTQVVATNPMEIVKLRMQLQSQLPLEQQKGAIGVVKDLGFSGLYRGVVATWARDVPYSMIFFPVYANAKVLLADENGNTSVAKNLACGCMAGMAAGGLMTPCDVIKTRFQQKGGVVKYGTVRNCLVVTLKNEGLFALYKGAVPRMVTQGPLFGIALAVFEIQKWYMQKQMQKRTAE